MLNRIPYLDIAKGFYFCIGVSNLLMSSVEGIFSSCFFSRNLVVSRIDTKS